MSTTIDSPRNESSNTKGFKHAAPIPILTSPHRRRPSIASSDGSPTSPATIQTPSSLYPTNLAPSSPTSSSFFPYLTSTSPKTTASFPYRRPPGFGAPPVFEGQSHVLLLSIIPLISQIASPQTKRAKRSIFITLFTNVVPLLLGPVTPDQHPKGLPLPHR